jgi:RHS repeat-associated protein
MLHFKHATAGSRWPMYDAIGTARRVVDDSRAVTDAYSLDAFGVEFASATGSTPNPYRYGGAWGYITDGSGLLQLGARFYWPELGRFVQQDPIGDGMNWYVYANGNPVVWVDPEGQKDFNASLYALLGGKLFGGSCGDEWFGGARIGAGVGAGLGFNPWGAAPGHGIYPTPRVRPGYGGFFGVSGELGVAFGPAEAGYTFGERGWRFDGAWAPYGHPRGWYGRASHNLLDYLNPLNWRLKATADVGADVGAYAVGLPF